MTGARSWFALENQVARAHYIRENMKPFREPIKTSKKFNWTPELEKLFDATNSLIISKVEHGIQSFDTNQRTCIQCELKNVMHQPKVNHWPLHGDCIMKKFWLL